MKFHFNQDFLRQKLLEVAFDCFMWSVKKNIKNVVIDEFAKHNPYSQRKELLDIPENII